MGFNFNLDKNEHLKGLMSPKIFLIFLGFVILFMLPFSLFLVSETIRIYATFEKTNGIVIDSIIEKCNKKTCSVRETIQYRYQNQNYTFSPKISYKIGINDNQDRQIGDSVNILYNPKKPNEGVINDDGIWVGATVFSFFSLFFFTIFVVELPRYFKIKTFWTK